MAEDHSWDNIGVWIETGVRAISAERTRKCEETLSGDVDPARGSFLEMGEDTVASFEKECKWNPPLPEPRCYEEDGQQYTWYTPLCTAPLSQEGPICSLLGKSFGKEWITLEDWWSVISLTDGWNSLDGR